MKDVLLRHENIFKLSKTHDLSISVKNRTVNRHAELGKSILARERQLNAIVDCSDIDLLPLRTREMICDDPHKLFEVIHMINEVLHNDNADITEDKMDPDGTLRSWKASWSILDVGDFSLSPGLEPFLAILYELFNLFSSNAPVDPIQSNEVVKSLQKINVNSAS